MQYTGYVITENGLLVNRKFVSCIRILQNVSFHVITLKLLKNGTKNFKLIYFPTCI